MRPSLVSPPLVLASQSPRRRELLAEAGIACEVCPAPFDDAEMHLFDPRPVAQAMSLAFVKAAAVRRLVPEHATVLGADTLCIVDGRPVGKPTSEEHARRVLLDQVGRSHDVVSGAALLSAGSRWLAADVATVTWGEIASGDIDRYIASGLWRGKAGGYNLFERIDAGWPISYVGDPTTIMGLPMRLIGDRLGRFTSPTERVTGAPTA